MNIPKQNLRISYNYYLVDNGVLAHSKVIHCAHLKLIQAQYRLSIVLKKKAVIIAA